MEDTVLDYQNILKLGQGREGKDSKLERLKYSGLFIFSFELRWEIATALKPCLLANSSPWVLIFTCPTSFLFLIQIQTVTQLQYTTLAPISHVCSWLLPISPIRWYGHSPLTKVRVCSLCSNFSSFLLSAKSINSILAMQNASVDLVTDFILVCSPPNCAF